jgi:signal peptidase
MAIPTLFSWFSPILPNVPWTAQSLMTVATTTIGFIILDNSAKPEATRVPRRTAQKEKDGFLQWTVIALIGLIVFWSSTGLLGFTPTIVASGSMVPTLRQGDLTFIASTPARTIGIGDIIQYRMSDMMVIHRVIDKYETGGTLWFITKGDANNVPDDPVSENQVTGKLILTIPQLGWISVNLKEMFVNTYTFLVTTLPQSLASVCTAANGLYAVTGLAVTSYGCLLLTYKDYRKEDKK